MGYPGKHVSEAGKSSGPRHPVQTREVCAACGMLTESHIPAELMGFGAGWHLYGHMPHWSPVQQGSWLQTGWQWHCGTTGAWHWPGEQAQNGAAEALAGQAVPLLGIWGEAGCHGSPEPTLGSNGSFPLSKTITPKKTSLGEPAPVVPLSQLPTATQRTAGQDGPPPPPSQGYVALAALCSLVARAPALVSVRASLCWLTSQ